MLACAQRWRVQSLHALQFQNGREVAQASMLQLAASQMRVEHVAPHWKMRTVERLCKADERSQQGLPRRALPRGLAARVAAASERATRRARSTTRRTKRATGSACAHTRASALDRAFLACAPFAATACVPLRPGAGPGARARSRNRCACCVPAAAHESRPRCRCGRPPTSSLSASALGMVKAGEPEWRRMEVWGQGWRGKGTAHGAFVVSDAETPGRRPRTSGPRNRERCRGRRTTAQSRHTTKYQHRSTLAGARAGGGAREGARTD